MSRRAVIAVVICAAATAGIGGLWLPWPHLVLKATGPLDDVLVGHALPCGDYMQGYFVAASVLTFVRARGRLWYVLGAVELILAVIAFATCIIMMSFAAAFGAAPREYYRYAHAHGDSLTLGAITIIFCAACAMLRKPAA